MNPPAITTATAITVELWQVGTLLVCLIGAFAAMGSLLVAQFERRMDERFKSLDDASKAWRDVELQVAAMRFETAEKYIRREDYMRGQTVIEAKLDAISSELKIVQIQGAQRNAHTG